MHAYRSGRLEVHIEIGLPDEAGRVEILHIHTKTMRENSFLAPDVNLQELGMISACFNKTKPYVLGHRNIITLV